MNKEEQKTKDMKQTAVEFIVKELVKLGYLHSNDYGQSPNVTKVIKQAKEMFEEQIKDAIIISEKEHIIQGNVYPPQFVVDKAEQYYKKTYGGNK